MITQQESNLGAANYTAIQTETGDLAVEIEVRRRGPVWGNHPDTSNSGWSGRNFDAIRVCEWMIRAYVPSTSEISVQYLASEVSGISDASWTDILGLPGDVNSAVPVSLASDDVSILRLFYYSVAGNICYTECTNVTGGTFGAPVVVAAVSSVIFLAAVSLTKVHYVTIDSDNNRRLRYYEYTGGAWASTDSDVYWPFPIYGFDAVAMTDYDLIAMSSEGPPYLGSRAIGTEVTVEVNRTQSIVTFRQANGRWSDYDLIDTVDIVKVNRSRDNLRLSYYNNIAFASYLRCGGGDPLIHNQDEYPYTYSKAAILRSADGISWEYPELIDSLTTPFVVIPRTDYLYLVGIKATKRSPACTWAGQTPVSLDITDYVSGYSSDAADIRSSQVQMENPGDVLEGTLAEPEDRTEVTYKIGYYSGGSPLTVLISTEDVEQWQAPQTVPRRNLGLVSRDVLGRVNRTRADYAAEWPVMQAGRDAYDDPSGTGYGGLRHTAPYKGSWKASAGILQLISSNNESVAVSTFVTDALNGSAQTGFYLDTASQGEYGGIVFRVFDKDNLFFVAYYLDDDVIVLKRRVGGTDTTLATSAAMSWVVDTYYWIRATVRYAIVTVYTSTDGITWTELAWASGDGELPGCATGAGMAVAAWTGKFGIVGYGYSDEDSWPDWEPWPWPGPVPPPQYWGMVALNNSQLGRSWNFFDDEDTDWEDILGAITGTLYTIAIGPTLQAYVTGSAGIWYCPSIVEAVPDWSLVISLASARVLANCATGKFGGVTVSSGGSFYAVWRGNDDVTNHGGYFTGASASASYVAFTGHSSGNPLRSNNETIWGVNLDNDSLLVFGCGTGGGGGAALYVGGTYPLFTAEGAYMVCGVEGFCLSWNGNMYNSYTPGGTAISASNDTYFGIDVLGGHVLHLKGQNDLYMNNVLMTTPETVFNGTPGLYGGRPMFTRSNPSEIAWTLASHALGVGEATRCIVWTKDLWTNYWDKTGDWEIVIGEWDGASGVGFVDGNSHVVPFPYSDEDLL